MKNLKTLYGISALFIFVLSTIFSCSTDDEVTKKNALRLPLLRMENTIPNNDANPYDNVGRLHTQLLEDYYTMATPGASVSQIASTVQQLADGNNEFNLLKGPNYRGIAVPSIQYYIDHQSSCIADALATTSMSIHAKSSFIQFTADFQSIFAHESDVAVLHRTVVDYENTILADSLCNAIDKEIILTATSILRHSACLARKKPKKNTDPDWIIFVGNVAGVVDGLRFGKAEAVAMGLVAGIAGN